MRQGLRLLGLVATGCGIVALLAMWWQAMARGDVGYLGLRHAADGTQVTVSLFEVARVTPPDGYAIRRGDLQFEVRGPTRGLAVGDELTVAGVMRGGALQERWRSPAPDRRAKKALGFLGLALTVGLVLVTVRVTGEGLALRG